MAFPVHLLMSFLVDGASVEVAVRVLRGADQSTRFANDADGVRRLVEWLAAQDLIGAETRMHACLATTTAQDDAFFASAFVEFAYDSTDNTFIWSEVVLREAMRGQVPSALAMLDACREQHHLVAIA